MGVGISDDSIVGRILRGKKEKEAHEHDYVLEGDYEKLKCECGDSIMVKKR